MGEGLIDNKRVAEVITSTTEKVKRSTSERLMAVTVFTQIFFPFLRRMLYLHWRCNCLWSVPVSNEG